MRHDVRMVDGGRDRVDVSAWVVRSVTSTHPSNSSGRAAQCSPRGVAGPEGCAIGIANDEVAVILHHQPAGSSPVSRRIPLVDAVRPIRGEWVGLVQHEVAVALVDQLVPAGGRGQRLIRAQILVGVQYIYASFTATSLPWRSARSRLRNSLSGLKHTESRYG